MPYKTFQPKTLSAERRQFIADLANDEWVDRWPAGGEDAAFDQESVRWDEERAGFLNRVDDPEEIHLFAELWNWDAGTEPLEKLAARPACEVATAKLLFWRSQPQEHVGTDPTSKMQPYERGLFEFARSLQRRVLGGEFKAGTIEYDPRSDYDLRNVPAGGDGPGWTIDPRMFDATP